MTSPERMICRRPLVEAGSVYVAVHLDEMMELCRRHGVDPHAVAWVEYGGNAEGPLLRFRVLLRRDGVAYLGCPHGTGSLFDPELAHEGPCWAASELVEKPLTGNLPEWWKP